MARLLSALPLCLAVALATPGASASEPETDNGPPYPVSSSDQFFDRDTSHWADQDLHDLVEAYQCVSGFPDGTFKGEQAATRFEVATFLKACLASSIKHHQQLTTHAREIEGNGTNPEHLHEPLPHDHPLQPHEHPHVPHEPSPHEHEHLPHPPEDHHHPLPSHEHPINPYILASIITLAIILAIYQYLTSRRINKLEKDVRKLSQKDRLTLKDGINLAIAIAPILTILLPVLVSLSANQSQNTGEKSAPQEEMTLQQGSADATPKAESFLDAPSPPSSPPGQAVETKAVLSPREQPDTEITFPHNPPPTEPSP